MSDSKPKIEYYFSFISLWSYVGSHVFRDLAQRHDAEIVYKPVDLLAVFAAGGGKPVKERALPRQAYRLVEMQRWRDIRGIDLVLHPRYYPADPSLAHRMLLAALRDGQDVETFVHACLRAVWADELDIADPATLRRLASANGLDGDRLSAQAPDAELGRQEAALTQEAIARQVFGAPFYFYRDEPFWGQDRLDLLDRAISSGRPPITAPSA
ncbi:2-hydroxychromene-2-carboxylate isomerase [Pollutimonas sp. M17]|uniref:2-hydroxychromene-2-carboxylate isomerase n=1 Tax=Pollutimonas sp. M17 TaxID=2962065 RepID=UPI0021F463A8|nr:2-hydroxychromene-2-carboxylate isomerase [Pollutimonas sp. M17]UYO92439.1 2-hydroxychromene-2-carboxylate isomerase [Pollutimonas sp. M17]HWK69869.1 2-hydroxychromene-2-carboxylate isomerase [Burkholderiaceae bacterium]